MAITHKTSHMRLDNVLVTQNHFISRSRARDAIMRGTVYVNGAPATKAAMAVPADAEITINDPAQSYVSRAALKLIAGLDAFKMDVKDKTCLDIGASTGGFTQVLLERGAAHVTALDVGHDQLDLRLRNHSNINNLEGLNARYLTADMLNGQRPQIIVCDVSFISLTLALPPALALADNGAQCVVLVKPQFEAGREHIGKGGIVSVEKGREISHKLQSWLNAEPRWHATGLIPSPVTGGDGNHEYLLAGQKDG